jgi:hypothetical protein
MSNINWSVGSKIQLTSPYNIANASTNAIWVRFKNYSNRINIWLDNTSSLVSDINIYIDDTVINWKRGHVLKFNFKSNLILNGNKVKFFTDKTT